MEELLNSPRNWTEDFPHENGNYMCNCTVCKNRFMGYKRRTVCKMCFTTESGDYYCKPCNKKVEKSCGKEPHCAAYSPLPNGLPDDDAIKAKIKSLGWEVDGTAESNDMIELAKWMRSLAQKTLDEKLECDHRYYSRTGRYMLYEDWCEKCGNYCHEV